MAKIVVGAKGLEANVFRWNVRTIFWTNEWANVRTNVGATSEQIVLEQMLLEQLLLEQKLIKQVFVLHKCFKTNFNF